MNKKYLLDACALIAYFNGELGSEKVEGLFSKASNQDITIYMHAVNVCEVFYDCYRHNQTKAKYLLSVIEKLPITVIYTVDMQLIIEAGKLKAKEQISFADAFVIGSAVQLNAAVVSSDHKEFDAIQKKKHISFYWIR